MNGYRAAHQIPPRGGIEQDVFSGWRKVLCYLARPHIKKWAKRQYNHRMRRCGRREVEEETWTEF